jgi:WD40 repeat protein
LLQPYGKEDVGLYFGRDQETRLLAEVLLRSKFVLLYGGSGTGKTSLIRCGLQGVFSPRDWLPVFVRRGSNFVESLRTAVLEQYQLRYALRNGGQAPEVPADLPLRAAIQRLFQVSFVPVYLILDQFEEIFTTGTPEEQKAFFQTLIDLRLLEEDLFCKILIVTREEYIAHFYAYEQMVPFLFDHRFRVEKMRRTQLLEVVYGTLTYPYPGYPPFQFSDAEKVPDQIVENLTDERGEVDLTTLQVYLDRLYRGDVERAPDRVYRLFDLPLVGSNKLAHVISEFLDEQMERTGQALVAQNAVPSDVRTAGEWPLQVLFKLVTAQGTKQHRTATEVHDALQAGRSKASIADVTACLERLAAPDVRVLNRLRFAQGGEEHYEPAHDRLAQQVFGKFNAEEVRQREALSTIANKQKRFAEAAGESKALQNAEYLTPGEMALVEQSLNVERLTADSRTFLQNSRRYHTRRRRRERMVAVFSSIAAVVFLGVAIFAFLQWRSAERARRVAALVSQSLLTAKTDATAALQTMQEALHLSPDNAAALTALHDIYSENEFYTRRFLHPDPVRGVFFPRDTQRVLYSWTEHAVYRRAWDGTLQDSLSMPDLTSAALSSDGQTLALGTAYGMLYFLAANNFQQERHFVLADSVPVLHIAFDPTGKTMAAATGYELFLLPANPYRPAVPPLTLQKAISALAFHAKDATLLIGYEDGTAEMRNTKCKILKTEKRHSDRVLGFSADPADGSITTAGRDGQMVFWKNNLHVPVHQPRANAVQWSPDSSRLFTCGNDYLLRSWSPQGEAIASYRGHTGFVNGLAVSSDGQYVASAGEDRAVCLWKTESKVQQRYGPHTNGVSGLVIAADGRQLVTVSDQGQNDSGEYLNDQGFDFSSVIEAMFNQLPRTGAVWDVKSGKKRSTIEGHGGGISEVALGALLATASDDGTIILRNPEGKALQTLKAHNKAYSVAFSPDGQYLISGGDSLCVLWDRTGRKIKLLPHPDVVRRVAFAPDGQCFATGCYDGVVRVYNAQGDSLYVLAPAHPRRVENLCFSPGGRYLLSAEWGNYARLWTVQGDSVAVLSVLSENKTGGSAVRSVAFSPDGRLFALGAEGGVTQVFRLNDGKPILLYTLQHYPKRAVLSLRFAADGKGVFTGSNDRWARWWWLPVL